MDALKALKSRRSIRQYQYKSVSDELIEELVDCARHAPSCYNQQPWEFIIVRGKERMKEIVKLKGEYSQYMIQAPVWIALGYNTRVGTKGHNLENTAVAAENLLLAAHSLGLGAVYTGAFEEDDSKLQDKVSEVLELPEHVHVVTIICVGWPDEEPGEKEMRDLSEMIHFETY